MAEIRTFQAIRPKTGYEERIAALPYDVFSLEEAIIEVQREPLSFLAIDRPEAAVMAQGAITSSSDIYENAASLLSERIADGYMIQDKKPCFYIYELTAGEHCQTGLGALCGVDDYLSGVICRHENTRADKEEDRSRHVSACQMQTGPVFLAYRSRAEITSVIQAVKEAACPVYDFCSRDGIRHRIWLAEDSGVLEKLKRAFLKVERLYIADGHHRCAAAVRYALTKRQEEPSCTGTEPWNYILSVMFADDQLNIMDYNRAVSDLNGLTRKQFLSRVNKYFDIEFIGAGPVRPEHKGMFGMYMREGWYALRIRKEYTDADPVKSLDVSLLQDYLLEPALKIKEPRTDSRISFIGGVRGLSELEKKVAGDGGVAFALYPATMEELFQVADAGALMPPKSTWFEPKLRSGLLLYSLIQN